MAYGFELTGRKFGRLTVLEFACIRHGGYYWKCKCECGRVTIVASNSLRSGHTQSCGCLGYEKQLEANRTHGMTGTPEHNVWRIMRQRCLNPNATGYKSYGGRGITICDRWMNFEKFYEDMGPRPFPHLTLERKDNDGDYEPGNCKWATRREQANNRGKR